MSQALEKAKYAALARSIATLLTPLRFSPKTTVCYYLNGWADTTTKDFEWMGWPHSPGAGALRCLRYTQQNPKVPDDIKSSIQELYDFWCFARRERREREAQLLRQEEEKRLAQIAAYKAAQRPSLYTLMKRRNAELEAEVARLKYGLQVIASLCFLAEYKGNPALELQKMARDTLEKS